MVSEKMCGSCKEWLPLSAFNKKTRAKDGLQAWCRECMKTSNNNAYAHESGHRRSIIEGRNAVAKERNFTYIVDYLQTHHCVDCGESDPVVLEFDHVRGSKRANIAALVGASMSLKTVQDEIEKCDVRCANCHRRVTAQRAGWRKVVGQQLPVQLMMECNN